VVAAAVTYREFELDRFFVPKELVLHATALLAGAFALRSFRRTALCAVDVLLIGFLVLSGVSAFLGVNGWAAVRALTLTASSLVVFWTARTVCRAGLQRPLLGALALAAVLAAAGSLLQTYGVQTDLFSVNRAPGGTLGNRNFVAHVAAFGLPLLLLSGLRARQLAGYLAAAAGTALVVAVLVLTRSRAAWLAVAAGTTILLTAILLAPVLRREARIWGRLAGVLLLSAAGVGTALLVPNSLRWSSENPYLDSIRGVANYQEGSGAGRLVQYRQSLRMAAAQPLFGVGPGNWPVRYPEHAAPRDPSLDRREAGVTSNPWPSSDWIAFVSERGFPAAVLIVAALVLLALRAARRLVRSDDPGRALGAAALLATMAAAVVAGSFDAVLLLAVPALIVWGALGALADDNGAAPEAGMPDLADHGGHATSNRVSMLVMALALAVVLLGVIRSGSQLVGMAIYASSTSTPMLQRAAWIDPGSYRLRVRLARPASGLPRAERCRHALAARAMFPNAGQARNLSRGCS
jgi:O-antigen ligase